MRTEKFNLTKLSESARLMYFIIDNYNKDVEKYDNYSLLECFNFVKNLPYIPDPEGVEAISRPLYSMSKRAKFRDCDDKTILLACFLVRRGIKFKLAFVSQNKNKEIHHICIYLPNERIYLDATYKENIFGVSKKFYKRNLY